MSSIFPRELCPFPVFPPCSLCPPCEPLFFYLWNKRKPGYRAVAKRRNVYAAMPSNKNVSSGHEEKGRLRQDTCPLRALCALRANQCFFIFGTNENRGIAPSQKEETLTPRCPRTKAYRAVAKRKSAYAAMLVLSVLSVRTLFFFKDTPT